MIKTAFAIILTISMMCILLAIVEYGKFSDTNSTYNMIVYGTIPLFFLAQYMIDSLSPEYYFFIFVVFVFSLLSLNKKEKEKI